MNSNEEMTTANVPSRRKFVYGVGAFTMMAAVAAAIKHPFSLLKNAAPAKPESRGRMITMLTEDGKLVQVDETSIHSCRRKANKSELLNWIKK